MAKPWAAFYDWILPEVPGCSPAVVDRALCDTAVEFYNRSGVLVTELSPIPVVAGTATYNLTPPAGYDVARIDELFYGNVRLLPVSNSQLAQMYLNWTTIDGTPQYYLRETTPTFRLVPRPDPNMTFSDDLAPRVVLVPSRAATQIAEDWIYEDWGEDIAAGAIARLMQMPQKPWTDLQRAAGFALVFHRAVTSARNIADAGNAGAILQVQLKRYF